MNNLISGCLLALALIAPCAAQQVDDRRLSPPVNAIIVAGQSNAINEAYGGPYMPRHGNIFQLDINDGTISTAADQLSGVGSEALPGNPTTSFMIPLADLLMDTGKWGSVLLIPIAVGGTYSWQWIPGGDENRRITTTASQLKQLRIKPTMILWMLGEGDAAKARKRGCVQGQHTKRAEDFRYEGN